MLYSHTVSLKVYNKYIFVGRYIHLLTVYTTMMKIFRNKIILAVYTLHFMIFINTIKKKLNIYNVISYHNFIFLFYIFI